MNVTSRMTFHAVIAPPVTIGLLLLDPSARDSSQSLVRAGDTRRDSVIE